MKVIFAHDHIFCNFNDDFYSNGGLSAKVLSRYKNIFGKIVILSRQIKVSSIKNQMTLASTPEIEFIKIPDFKSLSRYKNILSANMIIEKEVCEADLLIARLPSSIGSIAIKKAKKHNTPYAVEVVGCAWDALWNYGSIQAKVLAPFSYYNMKKIVKNSDFTLYVTDEFLQKKYPSNGITVGCSNVDIPLSNNIVLENRIKKIEELQCNKKIAIGMIGSLGSEYKGFDIAIKSMKILENKYPYIEFHILGSGNPLKWVEIAKKEKVTSRIHFDGTLEGGNEVLKWLDNIDIYIQPSKTEGLPRATIEAMSRGCPIVGAMAGGIPELLDDEFVHKKGDSVDLANKIDKLLIDKNKLKVQANINLENSKKYTRDVLDNKRNNFWNIVKCSIDKNDQL